MVAVAYPIIRSALPGLEADLKNPGAWGPIAGLGLMASGGSGFWNSVISWVKAVKDIKKSDVPNT